MHPDIFILQLLNVNPPGLLRFALFVTELGSYGGIWLLLGIGTLVSKPYRRLGMRLLLALIFVLVLVDMILKPLFGRPRPFMVLGLSVLRGPMPTSAAFPSGHAAAAFAGWVAWPWGKRGKILSLVYSVLIGWSRIYLGVHWPSDVIAGALAGMLCGYLANRLLPAKPLYGGAD